MKRNLFILALLMLVACAEDPRVVAFEAGKKSIEVDKRVLQECKELPELKGATDTEVLEAVKEWFNQYRECKGWKNKLNGIAKDAFNLK